MDKNRTTHLTTSELSIGYVHKHGEDRLFENLNLELLSGELVCFMGPNGIGKSSLIRTLSGLQKPLSGHVVINGTYKGQNRPQQTSVVLTDKISSLNMSVYEVVAFGRYPYLNWNIKFTEKDNQIIEDAIALVHIEHLVSTKVHTLSDGQLQLVMIARALAQDTPIVLLDEPTAHLDLNNRVEIMKLLRNLSRTTEKAILVATHDLDLSLQMADWIWLAGRNKNILRGIPEDLVLDGSFDTIFQFKGFDLKTGKVIHDAHKGITISLTGDGYAYLWTKNALERNGIELSDEPQTISVSIQGENASLQWQLKRPGQHKTVHSLRELIDSL